MWVTPSASCLYLNCTANLRRTECSLLGDYSPRRLVAAFFSIHLALIHRSAWNRFSRKFISKILHSPGPIPLKTPAPGTLHSPAPLELVTPMDRYACMWMRSCRKHLFAVRGFGVCSHNFAYTHRLGDAYGAIRAAGVGSRAPRLWTRADAGVDGTRATATGMRRVCPPARG